MKLPVAAARRVLSAFRWSYVAPRAAVVALVWASVHFGLDPLLKWGLVASGEAALGAKVEIGEVISSIRGGEILVTQIAAANPSEPMRNLLETEHVRLRLDGGQLLRKRVVVREGMISGIRFDTPRTTSGEILPASPSTDEGPSMLDPAFAAAGEHAAKWFEDLQDRLGGDLEAKLQTPRVLREADERWRKQYAALKARAESQRAECKQLEKDIREARQNPLRALEQLEQLKPRLARAEADLRKTVAEINGLPQQAKADRMAVDAARKQDEAFLREQLKIGNIDGDELTQYLLGETVTEYVSQATLWANRIRRWMPTKKIAAPKRVRGVTVKFGEQPQPRFLVERVKLAGAATLGGQQLSLVGEMMDASSDPQLHDKPLTFTFQTGGALDARGRLELDRRGEVAHDWLVIDCPRLPVAQRELGKAGRLAVAVAPGEASLAADLHVDGGRLSGSIEIRQSSTLAAATGAIRDDRIARMLNESLAEVDRLEARVTLSGELRRPKVKLESNLGGQLASGIRGAAGRYLTERRDRVAAKIQGEVDEQLAKLDARRQEAQAELMASLGENQQLITELANIANGKASVSDVLAPKIGKALQDKLKK